MGVGCSPCHFTKARYESRKPRHKVEGGILMVSENPPLNLRRVYNAIFGPDTFRAWIKKSDTTLT